MTDPAAFLAQLPEQDRLPFRNLALIRPQLPTPGQLELIESMARDLASPRLLALIARTPHWLAHGPVLQALAENEATPEALRRDLELAVALFDLVRDLDRAPAGERDERAETIRTLYQQLPVDLRAIIKQQAKLLARTVHPSGQTLELPPLPAGDPDWEALTAPPASGEPRRGIPRPGRTELLARAESTPILEELQDFLLDPDAGLRAAALRNPVLSEEILAPAFLRCAGPGLFEEVYAEARWYFSAPLREAIYQAPHCPRALARKLAQSRDLLALLEGGAQDRRALRRLVCLFTQLDESEYQYVTNWSRRRTPAMLRVIKIFFDRLQRRRTNQASGFAGEGGDGRWVSLKERVFMANRGTQPDQLQAALRDRDPAVFGAVLENPGLTARDLTAVIPILDGPQAETVAGHRAWGALPGVQEALLHNPRLAEDTALRLLQAPLSPRALLDLLRDPQVPHLAVKGLARDRLAAAWRSMAVPGRIQVLRASGGELLRHLPQEILADPETLRTLVEDRQVDPGILLRLARNKQTPREILDRIAVHPVLMAHPAVMSELLLNPKTPRQAASRVWGLLSESEQQHLLQSPHLPAALRLAAE
jgi:hypothetical protein